MLHSPLKSLTFPSPPWCTSGNWDRQRAPGWSCSGRTVRGWQGRLEEPRTERGARRESGSPCQPLGPSARGAAPGRAGGGGAGGLRALLTLRLPGHGCASSAKVGPGRGSCPPSFGGAWMPCEGSPEPPTIPAASPARLSLCSLCRDRRAPLPWRSLGDIKGKEEKGYLEERVAKQPLPPTPPQSTANPKLVPGLQPD